MRDDIHSMRNFLRALDGEVEWLSLHDACASALVDRKLGADEVRVIGEQPREAPAPSPLLVRRREEDDVPLQRDLAGAGGARQQKDSHQIRREHPLVVDRAAAVQVAILDDATERLDRPVLTLDGDDIHVREKQHGSFGGGAPESPHEDRARGGGLEELRLDSLLREHRLEIPRQRELVARRIHGIELDEALEMTDGLRVRGGPVDGVESTGHAGN